MRKRELGRAAAPDELDRLVEIDVRPRREGNGVVAGEADAHELGGAPALDALELRLDRFRVPLYYPQCLFTPSGIWANGSPPPGGFDGTIGY